MKHMTLFAFLWLSMSFANAQTILINEPEFDGNVIYANDSVGNGIPLEKIESIVKSSSTLKTIFSGKGTMMSYVKNCCSTIRVKQKTNLNFLVPFIERQDPLAYVKVFKLTKEKQIRSVAVSQAKMKVFGTVDAERIDNDFIKLTYKKYGQRSYLITIDTLDPGEYAVTINTGKYGMFYLFGID